MSAVNNPAYPVCQVALLHYLNRQDLFFYFNKTIYLPTKIPFTLRPFHYFTTAVAAVIILQVAVISECKYFVVDYFSISFLQFSYLVSFKYILGTWEFRWSLCTLFSACISLSLTSEAYLFKICVYFYLFLCYFN